MFNEEKNIADCLNSLFHQYSQNFNVIFIDDGSTDKTVETLQKLLILSSPLFSYTIISQKNKGAARAREKAINICNTPYVISLDADDRFSLDMTQQIEINIKEYAPDIILPNMEYQDVNGNYTNFVFYNENQNLLGLDCLENSLGGWAAHGCMCIKTEIFKKSYVDYYRHNKNKLNYINNDEIISRLNFYNSISVRRCTSTYFYQYNPNSTTKRINPLRYLRCFNAIILNELFKNTSYKIRSKTQIELFNTIKNTRHHLRKNKKSLNNSNDWRKAIRKSICYCLTQKHKGISIKNKLRLFKYYLVL